jgi:hypothetical protein
MNETERFTKKPGDELTLREAWHVLVSGGVVKDVDSGCVYRLPKSGRFEYQYEDDDRQTNPWIRQGIRLESLPEGGLEAPEAPQEAAEDEESLKYQANCAVADLAACQRQRDKIQAAFDSQCQELATARQEIARLTQERDAAQDLANLRRDDQLRLETRLDAISTLASPFGSS